MPKSHWIMWLLRTPLNQHIRDHTGYHKPDKSLPDCPTGHPLQLLEPSAPSLPSPSKESFCLRVDGWYSRDIGHFMSSLISAPSRYTDKNAYFFKPSVFFPLCETTILFSLFEGLTKDVGGIVSGWRLLHGTQPHGTRPPQPTRSSHRIPWESRSCWEQVSE